MASSTDEKSLPLPDVGDLIFIFVMWIVLTVVPYLLFSDGSAGWHLSTGNFILKSGTIPRVDLFSATFPDRAWVAYEWLFDVFIAAVASAGGLKLLAVVLGASIAFLFLAIYDRARKEGANILVASTLTVVAVLTAATHWLARPHLVTFWFIWIFVTTLEDYYRTTISWKRLFIVLSTSMLLWVNSHPGFMVGFIILAIYVSSLSIQSMLAPQSDRTRYREMLRPLLALSAVLGLCTFLNPYGIELHAYIWSYLRGDRDVIAATNEYLSPVFKGGLHPTCLEILFLAFAMGLFRSARRLSMPFFLTCLAFGHAALFAVRNMPLYAIVATPAIGRLLGNEKETGLSTAGAIERGTEPGDQVRAPETDAANGVTTTGSSTETTASGSATTSVSHFKLVCKVLADFNEQESVCKMHIIPIIYTVFLIVVAIGGGSFMGQELVRSTFDPTSMPIKTTEYIKEHKINLKHVFNFDNWAGYLIYTLNDRVFIDDRADFYGRSFYAQYSVAMAAGRGWQGILDQHKIDWVLFPKQSALARALRSDPNWKSVKSDEASELFARVRP